MKNFLLLSALALFLVAGRAPAADVAPDQLVKSTAEDVLAIIRQDKDIQAGNKSKIYALVDAKVLPHFDFARMTRLALGRNWGKATPEQQDQITKLFRDLLVRTYAVSLTQYRDQKLDYRPAQIQSDGDALVRTEVQQPGGQPISIDYSMHKGGDAWKVYDIAVGGVSLVTNYRGAFNDQVRSGGIDGLVKSLEAKNAEAGK